jgi:hypothetical protein
MKLSRRFQLLPCRAFCVTEDVGADRCHFMAEADGDHEQVHVAAADHVRETAHAVKVVMTRTVVLQPVKDEAVTR